PLAVHLELEEVRPLRQARVDAGRHPVPGLEQREAVVLDWGDGPARRAHEPCHPAHLTQEPAEQIDDVNALLHQLPAADDLRIAPPLAFDPLPPTDAVAAAPEHRLADEPATEESVRLEHRWVVAVIEPALQDTSSPLRGLDERARLVDRPRQGLLAEDVLAGLHRSQRDGSVAVGVG